MSTAPSLPGGETRLGPFFFTFRPQPGSKAITVPGFLVPLQWPPTNQSSVAPYSSFVFTEFAPSPVQPVWSVSPDSVAQWTGPAPPTPEASPFGNLQPLPTSHRTSLQPPTTASAPTTAPNRPSSRAEEGDVSAQPSSPRPVTRDVSDAGGESTTAPSLHTTLPAISITKGTDSSPSPSPPSLRGSGSDHHVITAAPRFRAKSVSPISTESLGTTLCNTDYELPPKMGQRRCIPDEWTKQEARAPTPIAVVDVDDAPPSPTRERPLSAASTNQ